MVDGLSLALTLTGHDEFDSGARWVQGQRRNEPWVPPLAVNR